MLRRNFEQRPKAVDLVDFPYVQDCLRLNVSSLAQRQAEEGVASGETDGDGSGSGGGGGGGGADVGGEADAGTRYIRKIFDDIFL